MKTDTDDLPSVVWTGALANAQTNLTALTDLGQFPNDYDVLTDTWNMKLVVNKTLSPGQSCSTSHTIKNILYDPASTDQNVLRYQREYQGQSYMVVVQGTLGHDTIADEQGLLKCGVDIVNSQSWKIQYDAGVNLKFTFVDTLYDPLTTAGVQSHQPVSNNIGYDQA